MADDQDLLDRFRPLADATFALPRPRAALDARVRRRQRHRRRMRGGVVVVAALAAIGAVVARADLSQQPDDVTTDAAPGPSTALPSGIGTDPRLVIGSVPPGLSSGKCTILAPEPPSDPPAETQDMILCSLDVPTTAASDGAQVTWMPGAATEEVRAAWARRDAVPVAAAAVPLGPIPGAEFTVVDGRPVVALGEVFRFDARPGGPPDRVALGWAVVVGEDVIQVLTEGLSSTQIEQLLGGLGTAPDDPGFAVPDEVLPGGARPVAQGPQRLWFQPDDLRPDLSTPVPGTATGITYALPDYPPDSQLLAVTVLRDLDAERFLASWSDHMTTVNGSPPATVERDGRSGLVQDPAGPVGRRGQVAMAVDDRTAVLVTAPSRDMDDAIAIAASVTVHS
ncbi:MAG: hypothetical protein ACOC9R_02665 [bacterium]